VISTWGFAAANFGRVLRRKELSGEVSIEKDNVYVRTALLHALGATGPVAVMEVEAFALKDECADAIL
jgi:hypothetical protein